MLVRLLTSALCAAFLTSLAAAQKDNVLIIIADDLGVDAVGAYAEGVAPPSTPNIDAFAASGVLFRNAWANPFCSPSRACIQTGRYSVRTGVGRPIPTLPGLPAQNVLRLEETTIPEMLDNANSGYAHAAIGKWHLSDNTNGGDLGPNLAGWSHFAGLILGWSDYYTWPRCVNGVTATSTTYSTTQIVDDALAWLSTAPEPWVCYLSFTAPHDPYHAPPANLHSVDLNGLDPEVVQTPFFKAMVEAMDTEIGRLCTTLGPTTMAKTNVVFLGDNGTPPVVSEAPFLPSHAKGSPYEGGVNVPLIVSGPVVGGAPREEAALVTATDVFASVLELCDVAPEVPFVKTDSVSFVPYVRAPGQPPLRSFAYAEVFEDNSFLTTGSAAIRNARYKLIRSYSGGPPVDELYDLDADPFETDNLLAGTLTGPQSTNYNELKVELGHIRSTSGTTTTYGSASCVGSNGNPMATATGTPQIGSAYSVQLQNGAPSSMALLMFGASNQRWGSLELPYPLLQMGRRSNPREHPTGLRSERRDQTNALGGAGCFLWASGEIVLAAITSPSGNATLDINLPNEPTLIAGSIFHAWVIRDPQAPNPFELTTSNGIAVVTGS